MVAVRSSRVLSPRRAGREVETVALVGVAVRSLPALFLKVRRLPLTFSIRLGVWMGYAS